MDQAAERGADLVLETRIRRRVASYLGGNGLYVPNLLLWFMAWVPSWWVRDEDYALDLEVEATLRSVHSGMHLYSGVHRIREEERLNDFERGWQLLGIFRVPGSLGRSNWRKVDRSLAPKAESKLALRLVSGIDDSVRAAVGSRERRKAFARRYAVVIGVSRFEDYRIQNIRFADADAREFHEYITKTAGIPAHNARLLLNGQATLSGIREAVAAFRSRGTGEDDEILIYFAGYGAWSDGEASIVPYDADTDRPEETTLSLKELAGLPHGDGLKLTVILDSPFVTRFQGRAAEEREIEGTLREALGGILTSPGQQVLAACEVGEGCVELEDLGHGLFTYYLIRGLRGEGDRDRDGEITWDEASAYARRMTEEHAPLEGKVQRPGLYRGTGRGASGEEARSP